MMIFYTVTTFLPKNEYVPSADFGFGDDLKMVSQKHFLNRDEAISYADAESEKLVKEKWVPGYDVHATEDGVLLEKSIAMVTGDFGLYKYLITVTKEIVE